MVNQLGMICIVTKFNEMTAVWAQRAVAVMGVFVTIMLVLFVSVMVAFMAIMIMVMPFDLFGRIL